MANEKTTNYGLRSKRDYDIPCSKTKRSSTTYFSNPFHEWKMLDEQIRTSATMTDFKRKLLSYVKPLRISLFRVFDIIGVKQLTVYRHQFSTSNEHTFRHNF